MKVVDFIDKSYQWYLDLQSKMQSKNKCRYMYASCQISDFYVTSYGFTRCHNSMPP